MITFTTFINNLVIESLHPELKDIVSKDGGHKSKQSEIAKKIRDLSERGEPTGIEGNMPKGSSRAYLAHKTEHPIKVDGKDTTMKIGTKVAIRAVLDKHHDKKEYSGMSLGEMQNEAENGDHHVNRHHRTLTEDNDGHYHTNEDGIFPPLIHHDYDRNTHSVVGHVDKITGSKFKELTKTKEHPKGIPHNDFCSTLERFHNKNNGRHWESVDDEHLNKIEEHPLVQKFIDYHGNFAANPGDYRQLGNLGVWKHPDTGKEHIVARDHGFGPDVEKAYRQARKKQHK